MGMGRELLRWLAGRGGRASSIIAHGQDRTRCGTLKAVRVPHPESMCVEILSGRVWCDGGPKDRTREQFTNDVKRSC